VGLYLFFINADLKVKFIDWIERNSQPCFFQEHFGFACPGCGFQRAVIELLKGNILESIKQYPALIPIIILIIVLLFHLTFRFKYGSQFLIRWFLFTVILIVGNYLIKLIIN